MQNLFARNKTGNISEQSVTVKIVKENFAPYYLSFSSYRFNENIKAGSIIAKLSTSDTAGDTHSYSLPTDNSDNKHFSIDGNNLIIKHMPNYEEKSSYRLSVKSTDQGGLSYTRNAYLYVNNLLDSGRSFYNGFSGGLNSSNTTNLFNSSNQYLRGLMSGHKWGRVDPDTQFTTDLHYYRAGGNYSFAGYYLPTKSWSSLESSALNNALKALNGFRWSR